MMTKMTKYITQTVERYWQWTNKDDTGSGKDVDYARSRKNSYMKTITQS